MDVSGRRFHCWRRGGHGRVNMVSALSESCDVYFYDIAQRIGIERITPWPRGWAGHAPRVADVGGFRGLNPTREWKQSRRGEAWLVGDTINAAIGQGFVLSSPLQLAVMTARLADRPAVCRGWCVRSTRPSSRSPRPSRWPRGALARWCAAA
jgi:penicillin-binding protein 2